MNISHKVLLSAVIITTAASCTTPKPSAQKRSLSALFDANLAMGAGDLHKALEKSRLAKRLNPSWENAYFAEQIVQDALDRKIPTKAAQNLMDALFQVSLTSGSAQMNQSVLSNAERLVTSALTLVPKYPISHLVASSVYARQDRVNQALEAAATACALEPNSLYAHQVAAILYWRMKDYSNALVFTDRAIELGAMFPMWFMQEMDKQR